MFVFLLVAALNAAPCANPSILSAGVQSAVANGALEHYTIAITVQNIGDARQPSNLLQSVDVFQDGQKVDQLGLKPLGPNQSQIVTYGFDRAADVGAGTTKLKFILDFNGRSGNDIDCRAGVETFRLSV